MSELVINGSGILDDLLHSKARVVVSRGGTRSGKSYALAQAFVVRTVTDKVPTVRDIVRKSMPTLRATAMQDVLDVINDADIYHLFDHNKTSNVLTYRPTGSTINFFSADEEQKLRGRKRHDINLAEGNELSFKEFNQLMFRTSGQCYIDFNPSDPYGWIPIKIEGDRMDLKGDVEVFVSTYKDNPYLPKEQIEEIEYLEKTDKTLWQVYGCGEYGKIAGLIYGFTSCSTIPRGEVSYGLDFGFTNSYTSLVKITRDVKHLYIEELIYERGLLASDIARKMKELKVQGWVIADNARPETIEELRRAGLHVKACKKGKDSVNNGIDFVKTHHIHVHENSTNTIKEFRGYKWEENKAGEITNEPVKFNDHSMDAIRYGCDRWKNAPIAAMST